MHNQHLCESLSYTACAVLEQALHVQSAFWDGQFSSLKLA